MSENTDQNNSEYGHFLRSECVISDRILLFYVTKNKNSACIFYKKLVNEKTSSSLPKILRNFISKL